MDDDDSVSVYSDDSDEEKIQDSAPRSGVAMMSLLSYYGLQDKDTTSEMQSNPEAFIDLPQFDATYYVKKLLKESPMEGLLSKDSQLVQEIRTLDSDMQMLVYENYNKFISATETIKRMKKNVEVMDDDMNDVKQKMESLSKVSVDLDNSLHEKRMKVDKIMRIKRLLNRLEFLTELPERLQEMISKEMYQKAVALYNKTINVLTKHSGVLSLKNIKQRTELMMIDLRVKVTNLLDDPTLDTTKLTQYVTILRMMQAPKPLVVQKLIAAHILRARSMIKSFQAADTESVSATPNDTKDGTYIKNVSAGLAVSRTRTFHQLLISGLLEACKGIHELFCNSAHILSESEETANDILTKDLKDHDHAHKMLVSAVEDVVVSNYSGIMINHVSRFFHDYHIKSNEVRELEEKLKKISDSNEVKISEAERSIINEYSREPTEKEQVEHTLRMLQLRLYDLEDECQNWLLLARQAIVDLLFLETTVIECSQTYNGNRVRRISSTGSAEDASIPSINVAKLNFAKSFAIDMLEVVGYHADFLFWRRMLTFVESYHSSGESLLKLAEISGDLSSLTRSSTVGTDIHSMEASSHGGSGDAQSVRNEIQKRVNEGKNIFDKMFDSLIAAFSDIITDVKPIMDVYQSLVPPGKTSKSSQHYNSGSSGIPDSINGFIYRQGAIQAGSTQAYKIQRNVIGIDLSKISSTQDFTSFGHDYVSHIVWSFCNALSQLLEIQGEASYGERLFSSGFGSFLPPNEDGIYDSEPTYRPSTQSAMPSPIRASTGSHSTVTKSLQIANSDVENIINKTVGLSSMFAKESVLETTTFDISGQYETIFSKQLAFSLIASNLLKRISPTILRRLDGELKSQELGHIGKDSIFKAKCAARLELAANELLLEFVETSSEMSRMLTIQASMELVKSSRLASPSASSIEELSISGSPAPVSYHIIRLCRLLHGLCLNACVILGETPPHLKSSVGSTNPAGGARRNARPTLMQGGNNASVHFDIERLFSQKIKVYAYGSGMQSATSSPQGESSQLTSSLDSIVGTVAKASIKAMHEYVRFLNISHLLYLRLQVQYTVIKQMAGYVVKEMGEVDSLVDQLTSTMFSRYLDANNISSFIGGGGGDESTLISRASVQSLQEVGKSSVLLPKHL